MIALVFPMYVRQSWTMIHDTYRKEALERSRPQPADLQYMLQEQHRYFLMHPIPLHLEIISTELYKRCFTMVRRSIQLWAHKRISSCDTERVNSVVHRTSFAYLGMCLIAYDGCVWVKSSTEAFTTGFNEIVKATSI